MTNLIEGAKQTAIKAHADTNHTYGNGLPYSHHLQMVVDVANEFNYYVCHTDKENVFAACWLHDVIEDCRFTYNDVVKVTNKTVAELVRACTNNNRGRNRAERMSTDCYNDLKDIQDATFVKLCDRIANVTYSISVGSKMASMYKKEHKEFKRKLRVGMGTDYEDMWERLDELFEQVIP